MREFECIKKYFAPLAKAIEGALDLQDDAAVLNLGEDKQLVIASDVCVEGVHFPVGTSPSLIARRALRINLSDIAAMGAHPIGYTQTLILRKGIDRHWIKDYASGLKKDQDLFECPLLGGDMVATVQENALLSVSMTVLGLTDQESVLTRSKAMVGDQIYVTGFIGDAVIGRKILLDGKFTHLPQKLKDYFLERFYLPTPRVQEIAHIKRYAHAAIDISDGFVADLGHICRASQTQALVNLREIPFSKPLRHLLEALTDTERQALIQELLTGGDDYELLLSVSPDKQEDFLFSAQTYSISLYPVGHMGFLSKSTNRKNIVRVIGEDGHQLSFSSDGYEHTW